MPRSTPQLDRNSDRDSRETESEPRLRSAGSGPLSIKLPDDSAKVVRQLSDSKGMTATDVLKRGVSFARFITEQLDEGNTFMIKRPDGQLEHVHFVF